MTENSNNCSSNTAFPSDCEILEGYRARSRERSSEPSEQEKLVLAKAEPVRLLLLDVDGVLTDGSLIYANNGVEAKSFNIQDGLGIRLVQQAEVEVGIITARTSKLVQQRAEELGMKYISQGVKNKRVEFEAILAKAGLKPFQVCYMGDDLIDLAPLTRAGLAACPANAVKEVQECCHFICSRSGGFGAVREICDLILRAKGLYERLVQQFLC